MKKNIQKLALLASVLILAITQPTFAQQAPAKTATPATTAKPSVAPKDKEAGKDEKGHTIYEGPKGGRYYMSPAGKKVYIKKTGDEKATPTKTAPKTAAATK